MADKLTNCRSCGAKIAKTAKRCPSCGAQQHIAALTAVAIISVLTVCIIVFIILREPGSEGRHVSNFNTGGGAETTTPAAESAIVLVDRDGVKITYTGAKLEQYLPGQTDGYALYVSLVIENSSDKSVLIQPVDSSVNDVMKIALSGMPMDVLAGKKLVTSFFFTNLGDAGIDSVEAADKIETIDFKLSVLDSSSLSELFKTDMLSVK